MDWSKRYKKSINNCPYCGSDMVVTMPIKDNDWWKCLCCNATADS